MEGGADEEPLWSPWVRPFTFRSSATAKKELRSSWATLTSPWYMKFKTAKRSVCLTFRMYNSGWACWFFLRTPLKNGEHAARITLWACTCWSSHASVTSKKSLSSLSSLNATLMFVSKSFHRKQNLESDILATSESNRCLLSEDNSPLLFAANNSCQLQMKSCSSIH